MMSRQPIRHSIFGATLACRTNQESNREIEYRRVRNLWAFPDDRMAVRFQWEWHGLGGRSRRTYGNELWEFAENALMRRREAINSDMANAENNRKFFWPAPGARPEDHSGIPDVRSPSIRGRPLFSGDMT